MFIVVDLPEPEGPITATKSLVLDLEVDPLQRLERSRALAEGLGNPFKLYEVL